MKIYPGGWSSGQLGARICWDGTWSGASILVAGAIRGLVAAVTTLLVVGRRDRSEIQPTDVALRVLAVSMLVEAAVGSALSYPAGWAWPLLAAAPTLVLVRRQVRREQLQHLAEVAR